MVRKNPAGNKPSRQPAKKSATTRAGVTSPTPMDKKSPVRAQEPQVDGVIPASDDLLREMGILTCQFISDLRKKQNFTRKVAHEERLVLPGELPPDCDKALDAEVRAKILNPLIEPRRLELDALGKLEKYARFIRAVELYAAKHPGPGKPQIELASILHLIRYLEGFIV